MADYNISAQITADTKGFESGVKKAQSASKKLGKSITDVVKGFGKSGLSGAITSAGLALGGIGLAVGTAVKAIKGITKALGECAEAYKVQLQAERALDTAINNSPYVSGTASKALKDFASEMQKVSNLGDEEIIPQMTQLVATGRTEAEVMKIIATASDMSASGAMSFDQAVTQLNATLNGNIGRLGQQNAELKSLTEEELKNGKAIDVLADKYKGLASATIDTSKQLKNVKGDFKEAIGEFTLPSSDMWNKFWTGFYEKGIEIINRFNDALDKNIIGKGIASSLEGELKKLTDTRERRLYSEDEIHLLSDEQLKALRGYLESLKKLNKEQQVLLQVAKDEKDSREYNAKIAKEIQEEEAKIAKVKEEEAQREKTIADLKDEYLEKIKKQETEWENIKKITGEAVSAEEKIKFYQNSLVDLMTQAGGQITENNQLYKDQLAIIQKLQKEINPEEKKTSAEWEKKLREQAIERLETEKAVDLERAKLLEQSDWQLYQIERQYNEKIKKLALERVDAEMQEALKSVTEYANAEEEKARITEYYKNEREQIIDEYTAKYKDNSKQEKKVTEKTLKETLRLWKDYAKKVGSIMKEIGGAVSDALKSIAGFIKTGVSDLAKLFSLNIDEALEKLLEFEDKILTFFIETVQKLPQFVASVIQSISTMFKTLNANVDKGTIAEVISGMITNLANELPSLISNLWGLISKVANGIVEGLNAGMPAIKEFGKTLPETIKEIITDVTSNFGNFEELLNGITDIFETFVTSLADNDIFADLGNLFSKILTTIVNSIDKLLPSIEKALDEIIPALGKFITDSIPSIVNLLIDVAIMIVKEIPKILSELIKALPVIINALLEALPKFFDEGLPELISGFIELIPDIIKAGVEITVELIKHLPEIIGSFITGLIKGFAKVDWWDVICKIFQAFIDGFKELFGINSPSTVFRDFGTNIWDGLIEGLKGIGEWFVNLFSKAWEGIKNAFSAVGEWASGVWGNIKDGFGNVGKWFKNTFEGAVTKIKSAFRGIGDWFSNLWDKITGKNKQSTEEMIREQKIALEMAKGFSREAAERIVDNKPIEELSTDNFKVYGGGVVGKAKGSQAVNRGLALVGEAGPELVKFRGGEQVLNSHNTQKALEGMGGTTINQNVTFNNLQDTTAYAMMNQFKQYNRSLAINGVI